MRISRLMLMKLSISDHDENDAMIDYKHLLFEVKLYFYFVLALELRKLKEIKRVFVKD
jgi:hypothetical protein